MYDEVGYLKTKTTPDGATTYSYSTRGELLSVTTPTSTGSVTVITYKHDALNQKVAKLVDGTVVEKYLWANLTTLLAIYHKDDNLKQRFEYADSRMPISMTQNGQKYYLHCDQVGSPRAISDTSHNIQNHEIEIHLFQRFSKKYSNWDERPRKDYTFII